MSRKNNHFGPERQSTRMSKIKNGGLDQYGAEFFEQQQFRTAGVEEVNKSFYYDIRKYSFTARTINTWYGKV